MKNAELAVGIFLGLLFVIGCFLWIALAVKELREGGGEGTHRKGRVNDNGKDPRGEDDTTEGYGDDGFRNDTTGTD